MYLLFEKVVWVDKWFDIFTTIIVCNLFYTFTGEIEDERELIYKIVSRIEFYEEDNATLEMSDEVSKILSKTKHTTDIFIN